ncbi:MAG TPA: ISAs1 family transposase [Verrucomicrobiota bacterium]|nr:ISAs1 family transposase [Verrucomicrobiota bacterium]
MKRTKPISVEEQQAMVEGVIVRPIEPSERKPFDCLMAKEHYLRSAELVGEQLRYVAEYQGQWLGLLTWSAAAFNLKERERWIGWKRRQKRRRLSLVVNNSRFLILTKETVPNLASRVMRLCLARINQDWQHRYAHEVLIAESFVDHPVFQGTCYKASGWTLLGKTGGYGRCPKDYYVEHKRPKQLWVRELRPGARTILRGHNLPATLKALEGGQVPSCPHSVAELERMRGVFEEVPDWRTKRGTYRVSSLICLCVSAALCGVHRGQRDLAAFARDLSPEQCAALRLPQRGRPRRYRRPEETTFFRLLSHVDSRGLEQALLRWQDHVLGPRPVNDDQVAVDGKELLSSQGQQIVSAYTLKAGRWLGSEAIATKSNEIPAAQSLLRRAPIEGMLVTADAMHTQTETARIMIQEGGADYLLTVKGNQSGVEGNVSQLLPNLQSAFSPSGPSEHRAARRT